MATHPRIEELERYLEEDEVPLEQLKDAFALVNKEVLKQPELVEIMGAEEVGLVTRAAEKIFNLKLATPTKAKKKAPKSAKARIAALAKASDEEEDWDDL